MPIRLGPWEIGLMLIIVLIVFGARKLSQVGDAIDKTIRELRKSPTQDEKSN